MYNFSAESISEIRTVNFDCIPVDSDAEKIISIQNVLDRNVTYRVSLLYVLNNIDQVFKLSITSTVVKPLEWAEVKIIFKPKLAGQSYTEYYIVDDTSGNTYRLTVSGKCFGPNVFLNRKKLVFRICKNLSEQRKEIINIINKSSIDATYQWLVPVCGQGLFQISTGNCGVIRAFESITVTMTFSGIALGVYTAEIAFLVLHQDPIFLNVVASVVLAGNPMYNVREHIFEKSWKHKSRYAHLMENSLNRLNYIPSASVFERYLDFGKGSVSDVTMNISQTLCVTNHETDDGCIQWLPDPDNVFIIDPIDCVIPSNESRLFTVRFRPKLDNEVYGYLLCGDYQYKRYDTDNDVVKIKHTWFRIPCVGNTWPPCAEWHTNWHCPTEVVLPPTVPTRTTFTNFMLSNKLGTPMHFKLEVPPQTNFVVMPMCGIVQGRGWQIINVALEPKCFGEYCENLDLIINRVQKARIFLCGSAEISHVEMLSHGYNPDTHAMYEFQPTITGCTNYCTAYYHNLTRMEMHMRVLSNVPWLGADSNGSIVLPPREIVRYQWWFFPRESDKVYVTTVTCSCICLIDGKPVGEPTEVFIHISGFSELPDLRVLPKSLNIHDTVVGESASFAVTLYNYGTCHFTSRLYHEIDGMGDDFSGDKFEIDSPVNSLKPSNYCEVKMTVTADGAGSRQVDIKYTVLFRTEFDEVEEIQPVKKTICVVWYDGIYPTIQVKRTISVKCPVILSDHCVWNLINIDEFNKVLKDCRPNKPLNVNLYAPDFCFRSDDVEFILVLCCEYRVPVPFSFRREKICGCEMVEVQVGISTYEMRHTCFHRPLFEISPLNGIVTPTNPVLIHLKFKYSSEGRNTLCFVLTLPTRRVVNVFAHVQTLGGSRGVLAALRRPLGAADFLAVLDCGRVPIDNLDPVIRVAWLYNPGAQFATWRLLRGAAPPAAPPAALRCLQYFAEVAPGERLAVPFGFRPTEMLDYEMTFYCSFGYDIVKLLVRGQGGLPGGAETRPDMPRHVPRLARAAHRDNVVSLSTQLVRLRAAPTHSLARVLLALANDTDHVVRFIWLPERIANVVNIVMTPWWGVLQPKTSEWITMTVYTLQEPATFTTTVSCEILDLTERRRYQRNELLRRTKIEKCNREFIITEEGVFHADIDDCPPRIAHVAAPRPAHLALAVCVAARGVRDAWPRASLRHMWEQTPPYDLLSTDFNNYGGNSDGICGNTMTMADIAKIIDGVIWDALHSKMFRTHLEYYAKEDVPTHAKLVRVIESDPRPKLSRRVTSGICDAVVNRAVFRTYGLDHKQEVTVLEAE